MRVLLTAVVLFGCGGSLWAEPALDKLNEQLAQAKPVQQNKVPLVERMANIPHPLNIRDWPDVSRKYYRYILREPGFDVGGRLMLTAKPKGKSQNSFPITGENVKTKSGHPGWDFEYFANNKFQGEADTKRIDSSINFKWDRGSAVEDGRVDHFSTRWTGTLTAPETRNYQFFIQSDDGSRVTIDGTPLFDHIRGTHTGTKDIELEKGKRYPIVVEYVEGGGEAKINFNWDYVSPKKQAEIKANTTFEIRMPTYLGSEPGGEIFTNVSPIVGAKMMGLDPNELTGFNIVRSAKNWYDTKHGVYRHGPGDQGKDFHSGIYGYWSSVYGVMLGHLFPEKTFRPYATGDPIQFGWFKDLKEKHGKITKENYFDQKKKWIASNGGNHGMYMGNHIGLLGAICEPTDVNGIIRWDCLATEWYHPEAYPTWLYYNPFEEAKSFSLKLDGKSDLYDSVSGKFVATAVQSGDRLTIQPDQAMVLVAVPPGAKIQSKDGKLLANGVIIDHQLR